MDPYKYLNVLSSVTQLDAGIASETYTIHIVTLGTASDLEAMRALCARYKYALDEKYVVHVLFDHSRDRNEATVFPFALYTKELESLLLGVLRVASEPSHLQEIDGRLYRRLSLEEFKVFTGYDDYTIKNTEVRPDKFKYTVDGTARTYIDWRGRQLLRVAEHDLWETKDYVCTHGARLRKPTAVWYPDGKIFYFDDNVYEPLETEHGL